MRLKYLQDSDSAHKSGPRLGCISEAEILALLGRDRCHFPIGAAAHWLPNDGPALRRVAEFIGDLVCPSLGEVKARRIATAAVGSVQCAAPSSAEIIITAIGRAVDLLNEEAAEVRKRLLAVTRPRGQLAAVAAERKVRLDEVRRREWEVASLRRAIAEDEIAFRGNKPVLRLVRVGKTRELPRAERALAAAKALVPAYRLGAAARRTRDELKDRRRRIRDCRRALKAAALLVALEGACRIGSDRSIRGNRHG